MKYITLIMLVFSTFSFSEKKEIICELEGSFSVTYRDLSKTVISEGLDFFKNLATQTQQSIFLINKAKTKLGFEPEVPIEKGLRNYINWYKDFAKLNKNLINNNSSIEK